MNNYGPRVKLGDRTLSGRDVVVLGNDRSGA